eukprot:CAMPEP_0113680610 /NCGR_PEP_ID=MMETSP0038_2-20120614/11440_1 /TAXON_ID=2898 /ORGANISM="Cryptomonas paramecium" /LENGTH=211 /DNA_ID=CAMNT_0000599061 /DNA_START=374 /DNA_END=1006 /DNA_ORIENTATION=+ /assembly_acc=CAM_ASM_000170
MNKSDISNLVSEVERLVGSLKKSSENVYSNPHLSVHLLDRDFGPASKLLGALMLEADPNAIIVTVDDDCKYSPDLVGLLAESMPPDGALGSQCEELPRQLGTSVMFFFGGDGQRALFPPHVAVECHGWLMGYAGAAYRRGSFGPDVFDYLNKSEAPRGCFLHDDVWISGYLFRRGVRRFFLPAAPEPQHVRHPTQSINAVGNTKERHQLPC